MSLVRDREGLSKSRAFVANARWILADASLVETNMYICSKDLPWHVEFLTTGILISKDMSLHVQLLKTKPQFARIIPPTDMPTLFKINWYFVAEAILGQTWSSATSFLIIP